MRQRRGRREGPLRPKGAAHELIDRKARTLKADVRTTRWVVKEMLEINGKGIVLTRGDTTRFTIRLEGRDVADDTRTVFTVKKSAWRHAKTVIEKEISVVDGAVHVFLEPEDTDIDAGEYVWDIRVAQEDESATVVLTPMWYGTLRVAEAIGCG